MRVHSSKTLGQPVAESDLRDAIWWALRNAGLVIAYPQMDLHLDERGVEALRGRIPPKTE